MKKYLFFIFALITNELLALDVIIPNFDVPVGCYPGGKFIYHEYNVVMLTGLETGEYYYIRRYDQLDNTPPLTYLELLYTPGYDYINRPDFEIVGWDDNEGRLYKYTGTSSTAYFDYNFEIPNSGLILNESTNRPTIRIRKQGYFTTAIIKSSTITIVNNSSITGSLSCNSSGVYYLQDQPYGSSVSWTIKQNSYTRALGNGTTAQANNLTNGTVDVEFDISFDCDLSSIAIQNSFWEGVPAAPATYPVSPIYESINSVFYVSITDSPGADPSTGTWDLYGCVSPEGTPSGSIAEFFSCNDNGCGTIYVSTSNGCGTLYRTALTVITGSGGDCGELPERIELPTLKISPNPADDFVEINIDSKSQKKANEFKVEIYNVYFRLVKSFDIYNSTEKFSVSDLPKGNYVIFVHNHDFQIQGKLIIQR